MNIFNFLLSFVEMCRCDSYEYFRKLVLTAWQRKRKLVKKMGCILYIEKRFYTRGTIKGTMISLLAIIPSLIMNG